MALLKVNLDLTQGKVKTALEILGEKNVPPERLAAKLVEIAGKFKEPSNGGGGAARRRFENHHLEGGSAKGDPGRRTRQGRRNFG